MKVKNAITCVFWMFGAVMIAQSIFADIASCKYVMAAISTMILPFGVLFAIQDGSRAISGVAE